MLVWSEASITVHLAQPLRVSCSACGQPYVWLARNRFQSKVQGLPYVSLVAGGQGRKERLSQIVESKISERTPLKEHRGRCPSCQENPPLQEREPLRAKDHLIGGLMAIALGTGIGFLLSLLFGGPIPLMAGAALGVAFTVAAILGSPPGRPRTPEPAWKATPQPAAATEADWSTLLDEAAATSESMLRTLGMMSGLVPPPTDHGPEVEPINAYLTMHESTNAPAALASALVASGHDPEAVTHVLEWRDQLARIAVHKWLDRVRKPQPQERGETTVTLPLHDWTHYAHHPT